MDRPWPRPLVQPLLEVERQHKQGGVVRVIVLAQHVQRKRHRHQPHEAVVPRFEELKRKRGVELVREQVNY